MYIYIYVYRNYERIILKALTLQDWGRWVVSFASLRNAGKLFAKCDFAESHREKQKLGPVYQASNQESFGPDALTPKL